MTGYVVHESELNGGSAARVVAIDASKGSSVLELHLARYGTGSSGPHTLEGMQEIMYTASGSGTLAVGGESHELEPGTAVYLPAGATYEVDNPSPEELLIISATAPQSAHELS